MSKMTAMSIPSVAFNRTTMEWVVVARRRLVVKPLVAICTLLQKMLHKCRSVNKNFELGVTLQGILLLTGQKVILIVV